MRAALALTLAAGCGVQAGEDYPGEPLLQIRGEAVVAALTGGQPVEPALCFWREGQEELVLPHDLMTWLPPEVADVYAWPPDLALDTSAVDALRRIREAHIVSMESRGEFPSQFEVDVYVPPPEVTVVSAFEGEPRKAVGEVCAVLPGYGPLTHEVFSNTERRTCSDNGCGGRLVIATKNGERAYAQAYRCPADVPYYDASQCTEASAGDDTLLVETYAEGVVGASRDPFIVYLADPAPAGSYAAWELGASEGLAAGYHVFALPLAEADNARAECIASVHENALAEIEATYAERVRAELGDGATIFFPFAITRDGDARRPLPDDVLAGGHRILAEHEMANCPMPERTELDPLTDEISLTIEVYEQRFRGWPASPPPGLSAFP